MAKVFRGKPLEVAENACFFTPRRRKRSADIKSVRCYRQQKTVTVMKITAYLFVFGLVLVCSEATPLSGEYGYCLASLADSIEKNKNKNI